MKDTIKPTFDTSTVNKDIPDEYTVKAKAKDGKRYQAYFNDIATGKHLPPGITDVENVKYLQGIEKLEEINALHTIDFEKIVKMRKETSGTDVIFVGKLKGEM